MCASCLKVESEDHWEYCTNPGVCGGCGKTVEGDGIIIEKHVHTWKDYTYNETEHWHHCERCGNDYHRAAHWNNCLNSEVCAACGIPFTGKVFHINENPDDYVQYDAENHQFPCENCHETVLEAHDFVDGVCRLCGYKKTETAPAEYKLQNLLYNGKAVTGKVAHTGGTAEGDSLSVRVTFFITGNYYMATVAEVEADGSFIVEGVGPIEYISVLALGEENGQSKTYSSGEIFVQ